MKRAPRRGYALIYLLAALPLIAVVGNVAVLVTSRALAAQRLAVAERTDDGTRNLLLLQLRRDARTAERAEGDANAFSDLAAFRIGERIVEYRCASSTVTRVERESDVEVARTTWTLQHGTCAFQLELLANGRAVVWLRCDVSLPVRQRAPVTRQYTTAVAVGAGGQS